MKIELSERMQAVSALVPKGHVAADIGCDHGFVSIDLVQRSICPRVYAADVRKGRWIAQKSISQPVAER